MTAIDGTLLEATLRQCLQLFSRKESRLAIIFVVEFSLAQENGHITDNSPKGDSAIGVCFGLSVNAEQEVFHVIYPFREWEVMIPEWFQESKR